MRDCIASEVADFAENAGNFVFGVISLASILISHVLVTFGDFVFFMSNGNFVFFLLDGTAMVRMALLAHWDQCRAMGCRMGWGKSDSGPGRNSRRPGET